MVCPASEVSRASRSVPLDATTSICIWGYFTEHEPPTGKPTAFDIPPICRWPCKRIGKEVAEAAGLQPLPSTDSDYDGACFAFTMPAALFGRMDPA